MIGFAPWGLLAIAHTLKAASSDFSLRYSAESPCHSFIQQTLSVLLVAGVGTEDFTLNQKPMTLEKVLAVGDTRRVYTS